MKKYVLFTRDGSSKKFIQSIYRNSTSKSTDIGDAIEFVNEEQSIIVAEYLSKREKEDFFVMCIETTITILGEEDNE